MKQILKAITIVILFFFGLSTLQAQETVTTSGGEAVGSSGSASYTVGQLLYTTQKGTNGNSATQGVQQPYEISVVTGLQVAEGIYIELSAL